MKTYNFALIGCGRISPKHISALKEIPEAKLVAVCDNVEAKAKATGTANNVPWYTDYHEMLKKEQIDIVNILTPSGNHAEIGIEVAKSKKHIIVEKPMALRLDDADKLIKTCDENGVKLFVVKQNRYNLAITKLREAVDAGRFGKMVLGTVRVRWCRRQDYYDQDAWRGTWAMDGGVLSNQASHHIDLLEWMMGPVESVMCKTGTMLVDIETEDTAVAILKFSNGALGVIEATNATRPKDVEGSISILGEKGMVEVGGFAANKMVNWNFENKTTEDDEVIKNFFQNPPNVYGFGHKAYIQDVIYCIEHNKKALVDGIEGRKSLELINALYESSETGKEVFLTFRPLYNKLGRKTQTNH
jgi:predicted dehydrogenase